MDPAAQLEAGSLNRRRRRCNGIHWHTCRSPYEVGDPLHWRDCPECVRALYCSDCYVQEDDSSWELERRPHGPSAEQGNIPDADSRKDDLSRRRRTAAGSTTPKQALSDSEAVRRPHKKRERRAQTSGDESGSDDARLARSQIRSKSPAGTATSSDLDESLPEPNRLSHFERANVWKSSLRKPISWHDEVTQAMRFRNVRNLQSAYAVPIKRFNELNPTIPIFPETYQDEHRTLATSVEEDYFMNSASLMEYRRKVAAMIYEIRETEEHVEAQQKENELRAALESQNKDKEAVRKENETEARSIHRRPNFPLNFGSCFGGTQLGTAHRVWAMKVKKEQEDIARDKKMRFMRASDFLVPEERRRWREGRLRDRRRFGGEAILLSDEESDSYFEDEFDNIGLDLSSLIHDYSSGHDSGRTVIRGNSDREEILINDLEDFSDQEEVTTHGPEDFIYDSNHIPGGSMSGSDRSPPHPNFHASPSNYHPVPDVSPDNYYPEPYISLINSHSDPGASTISNHTTSDVSGRNYHTDPSEAHETRGAMRGALRSMRRAFRGYFSGTLRHDDHTRSPFNLQPTSANTGIYDTGHTLDTPGRDWQRNYTHVRQHSSSDSSELEEARLQSTHPNNFAVQGDNSLPGIGIGNHIEVESYYGAGTPSTSRRRRNVESRASASRTAGHPRRANRRNLLSRRSEPSRGLNDPKAVSDGYQYSASESEASG